MQILVSSDQLWNHEKSLDSITVSSWNFYLLHIVLQGVNLDVPVALSLADSVIWGMGWDSWLFNLAWSLLFVGRVTFSGHNLHTRGWGDMRWRASLTGSRTQYHPVNGITMLPTELTRLAQQPEKKLPHQHTPMGKVQSFARSLCKSCQRVTTKEETVSF